MLTKQKSKVQLRRIDLEHRLLATREVLKLQNEQILSDMNSAAGTGTGTSGSGGATPISFSEAATRILSRSNIRRRHSRGFHAIVDKYMAHSQMLAAQNRAGPHGQQTPLSAGGRFQLQRTPSSGAGAPQSPGGAFHGFVSGMVMEKHQNANGMRTTVCGCGQCVGVVSVWVWSVCGCGQCVGVGV